MSINLFLANEIPQANKNQKNVMLRHICVLNEGVGDMEEVTSLTNMRGS